MLLTDTPTTSLNIEYLLLSLWQLLTGGTGDVLSHKEELLQTWNLFYLQFSVVSTMMSLLLLFGIAYSIIRLKQVRAAEYHAMHEAHDRYYGLASETGSGGAGARKWQQVQAHVASQNPSEWRLAILEADIILDEMVYEYFGERGDTLGERLKKIDRSDFVTIDKAWEAHRIRNAIAHEGSSFELSEREMKNILRLYEEVFAEFKYI